MRDDPTVVDLVTRARAGDRAAWDAIVERYATLVWSVCRKHGLSGADLEDVGAVVWLRLVERLDSIREPAALAGWLRTTARHECLYLLRTRARQVPVENHEFTDEQSPASDEWLLAQERQVALRAAFAELPDRCRQLLAMLFADPPATYAEIGAAMGMAIGAIGPNRQRCIDKLRGSSELAGFMDQQAGDLPAVDRPAGGQPAGTDRP